MSDHIVVQLADGVYPAAPLRLTAADSGNNGHTVIWQAGPISTPRNQRCPGRHWLVARRCPHNMAGHRSRRRQLYVNGTIATRARSAVNGSQLSPLPGLNSADGALSFMNNLANQEPVPAAESIGLRHGPVPVGAASRETSPRCDTRLDQATPCSCFAHPQVPGKRSRAPGLGRRSDSSPDGALSSVPLAGQNMNTISVEAPVLPSLVDVGHTYDTLAHTTSRSPPSRLRHHLAGTPRPAVRPADPARTSIATGTRPASAPARRGVHRFERPPQTGERMGRPCRCLAANTIASSVAVRDAEPRSTPDQDGKQHQRSRQPLRPF